MPRLFRLPVVLLAGLVLAALPWPGSAQTLSDALIAAYNNNPTLQAARAQLRATDEQVPEALSNYRPTVTGTGNLGRDWTNQSSAFFSTGQVTNPRSAGVTITEPLYRGGRTEASVDRAENLVKSGRAQLSATEQSVLLAAATAYVDVYRDQAVLDLNISNEQVLRRRLEDTEEQFKVGIITKTDVSQAEARLAQAVAERIQAENNLNSSRAVYRNVTGTSPGTLEAPEPLAGIPGTSDEALAGVPQNPTVIAAGFNELAAREDVRISTGELYPTLSLNGTYDHGDDTLSKGSYQQTTAVFALLNMPIYPGSAAYARIRAAKQVVQQRRKETEAAERNAAQDATQAFESLISAQAQVKSFDKQIQANEIALEGVRQEESVGTRTVLDILNAQQELLDSRVNKVQAEHDALVAVLQLKTAMGRLTAQALDLPVAYYDVNAYYEEVRDKLWGVGDDIR